MHRLCIDIDNVVARTDEVMRRVIHDFTGGRVRLEYEDIKEFDYYKCQDSRGCGITKEEWSRVHDLFSEPRYLWLIQPFEGVQEHLKALGEKFVLHLATSRKSKARRTTVEWLEAHGFPPHDVHFLKPEEKHFTLGGFYAAIEDHYEQAALFAEAGTACILIEHPWNKGKPAKDGVRWVKGWAELAASLLDAK